jgi:hypothetical protein
VAGPERAARGAQRLFAIDVEAVETIEDLDEFLVTTEQRGRERKELEVGRRERRAPVRLGKRARPRPLAASRRRASPPAAIAGARRSLSAPRAPV